MGVASLAAERVCATEVLRVGGVVPFTTGDYPGKLAAVVFCQGCPWRCRYCHNPHLLAPEPEDAAGAASWADVLAFLEERRGLLDAVVLSGGEPTAQAGLNAAIRDVRCRGFGVALHTAGIYPRRFETVLPLVDWVGFDIKAPGPQYAAVTGIEGSGSPAFTSLDLLRASGVPFEVRTTVHPALTPPESLVALACSLAERGIRRWVLQPFRTVGCRDASLVADTSALDGATLERLRAHVPEIFVR